jgi:hypothetical protein
MDDFNLGNLNEARNEWSARLVNIVNPQIIDGFNSMFKEAYELCVENEEDEKYLMTFQNFLSRIPKWNQETIETEVKRISETSRCSYLEDLITCVHIVQLKALTSIRVGQKQKQIDISIPKLSAFIHKIYILVARKLYTNIFLFEIEISPLEKQKNNRELELIIKESILNAIRESIPIEQILQNYLEETTEDEIIVSEDMPKLEPPKALPDFRALEAAATKPTNSLTLVEEMKPALIKMKPESMEEIKLDIKELSPAVAEKIAGDVAEKAASIQFNDIDKAMSVENKEERIVAPKTIERLENIAEQRSEQRKAEEAAEAAQDDSDKIQILDASPIELNIETPPLLDDIITLR